MKTCGVCRTEKPLTDFYKDTRRGHGSRCKDCTRIATAAWRNKDRAKYNESERRRYSGSTVKWEQHIKRKYGITAAVYEEMMARQNRSCAICKRSAVELGKTLAVDHDHVTNAVRGLLCAECNRMLGCAADVPSRLVSAAEYLINAEQARIFIECVMECRP